MVGKTTYASTKLLEWTVGRSAMPAQGTAYLALFTAAGNDDGTGFAEVAGGGYARLSLSGLFGAASGPAGSNGASSITNTAQAAFPTATGDWGTVVAIGYFDAPTGGNLREWAWLGASDWLPFVAAAGTPCLVTLPGHGLADGDKVAVTAEFGGMLPPIGSNSLNGVVQAIPTAVRYLLPVLTFGAWTKNDVAQVGNDGGTISGWIEFGTGGTSDGQPTNWLISVTPGAEAVARTYSGAADFSLASLSDPMVITIQEPSFANGLQLTLANEPTNHQQGGMSVGFSVLEAQTVGADAVTRSAAGAITVQSWAGLLTVANVTTDTFNLGITALGGGSAMLRKVTPQAVAAGVTFSAPPGALKLLEA